VQCGNGVAARGRESTAAGKSENLELVKSYFAEHGNKLATAAEVAEATGLSAEQAREVMGRRYKRFFDEHLRDGGPRKEWRLKAP
jgi:hypothetical protein